MGAYTFTVLLTQEQFAAAVEKLKAAGLGNLSPTGGILPKTSGVELMYMVENLASGLLITFTVLEKPLLAPVGMIAGRVRGMLEV